jgi:hypothetical protein
MQILLLAGEFAAALIFLPILLLFLWTFGFWQWITGETAREYRRKEAEWNTQQAEKAAQEAKWAAEDAAEDARIAERARERAEWTARTGETSEQAWMSELGRRLRANIAPADPLAELAAIMLSGHPVEHEAFRERRDHV